MKEQQLSGPVRKGELDGGLASCVAPALCLRLLSWWIIIPSHVTVLFRLQQDFCVFILPSTFSSSSVLPGAAAAAEKQHAPGNTSTHAGDGVFLEMCYLALILVSGLEERSVLRN